MPSAVVEIGLGDHLDLVAGGGELVDELGAWAVQHEPMARAGEQPRQGRPDVVRSVGEQRYWPIVAHRSPSTAWIWAVQINY